MGQDQARQRACEAGPAPGLDGPVGRVQRAQSPPIPYLPMVEALGNYLSSQDTAPAGQSLGAARRELASVSDSSVTMSLSRPLAIRRRRSYVSSKQW